MGGAMRDANVSKELVNEVKRLQGQAEATQELLRKVLECVAPKKQTGLAKAGEPDEVAVPNDVVLSPRSPLPGQPLPGNDVKARPHIETDALAEELNLGLIGRLVDGG